MTYFVCSISTQKILKQIALQEIRYSCKCQLRSDTAMKRNIVEHFFTLQNYFFLYICFSFYATAKGNSKPCENYYRVVYKNITGDFLICMNYNQSKNNLDSEYEFIYSTCDREESNEFLRINIQNIWNVDMFVAKHCALESTLFSVLRLPNLKAFVTLPRDEDTILKNDIFHAACTLVIIRLPNNSIVSIESKSFDCLTNLYLLDLSYNKIEILPPDVFKHQQKLQFLYLSNNNIETLSNGTFDNLTHLTLLDLHSNQMYRLSDRIFHKLKALDALMLNNNRLKSLNPNAFSNLTSLTNLDLTSNHFKNIFIDNRRLVKLNISNNSGLVLDKNSFSRLVSLEDLYMNECNLTSLPRSFFRDNPKLQEVHLKNNRLRVFSETFADQRDLRILDLSFNNIETLRDQPFRYNTQLLILRLFQNNLSQIRKNDFRGLFSLTDLDLSSNFISEVDSESFRGMSNLFYLNISHNRIRTFSGPRPFGNGNILSKVDISYNCLTDIGNTNWQELPYLEEFRATNNEITHFIIPHVSNPGAKIHLECNKIRRLYINSTNVTLTPDLKTQFYLTGNSLDCDCEAYELYTRLKDKNFSSHIGFANGLNCEYPLEHKGKKLSTLKLNDFTCNITRRCPKQCTCTYRMHDAIQVVNCSRKDYAYLPFEAPPNTNILHIDHNRLVSLEHLSNSLWENLTRIHAEGNQIAFHEFYIPGKVTFLGLRGNKLKTLSSTIERHAESVNDFRTTLSNNPWPCDCSVLPFKKWLSSHLPVVMDLDEVRCMSQYGFVNDETLLQMTDFDLCLLVPYAQYVISGIMTSLLISIFVFYYRLYILSLAYTHCNSCYKMFFCNRFLEEDKMFDCFVSYSATDREVTLAILEELETKPPHYSFCIHERNWVPGRYITSNIIDSVQNSRKTLIIISKTFLESEWFHLEFQAAYRQTLRDRIDRLILVFKGYLPDERELNNHLRYVISTKTYLRWGERWFWEKLRYAIHRQNVFETKERKWSFRSLLPCLGKGSDQYQQDMALNRSTAPEPSRQGLVLVMKEEGV